MHPNMPTATKPLKLPRLIQNITNAATIEIKRASPNIPVDEAQLCGEIVIVIHTAIEIRHGGVTEPLWLTILNKTSTTWMAARGFRLLAAASNLLDHPVHDRNKRRNKIDARLRRRERSMRVSLPPLTSAEHDEIEATAYRIEFWHQSYVRASRPRKTNLDAALALLAQTFARHTGFDRSAWLLPHAVESHFIRFAGIILSQLFDASEASQTALARRWNRQKRMLKLEVLNLSTMPSNASVMQGQQIRYR